MSSSIDITIDEATLKKLVRDHLEDVMGGEIEATDVKIEVKSAQNYRSEWEVANFRATVRKLI